MNFESIKKAYSVLEELKLFKNKFAKNSLYSNEFLQKSKNSNYIDAYNAAINNLDFDILLTDDSFFQFEERVEKLSNGKNTTVVRFAYFENPYNTISYAEYLQKHGFNIDEIGDELRLDYEQDMSEKSLKEEFFTLRYDCSEGTYKKGIHPYSHFHIGFRESFSIPINKHISPLVFVNFVLKSRYYSHWSNQMTSNDAFSEAYFACKKDLFKVHSNFFSGDDNNELHIT